MSRIKECKLIELFIDLGMRNSINKPYMIRHHMKKTVTGIINNLDGDYKELLDDAINQKNNSKDEKEIEILNKIINYLNGNNNDKN